MGLDPIVMGTKSSLAVAKNPAVNMTAIPVTVVFDSPHDPLRARKRIVLKYLNGGTDGFLATGNLAVQFDLTPVWTATELYPGDWVVRFLTGVANVDQIQIAVSTLQVISPAGGPMPTAIS